MNEINRRGGLAELGMDEDIFPHMDSVPHIPSIDEVWWRAVEAGYRAGINIKMVYGDIATRFGLTIPDTATLAQRFGALSGALSPRLAWRLDLQEEVVRMARDKIHAGDPINTGVDVTALIDRMWEVDIVYLDLQQVWQRLREQWLLGFPDISDLAGLERVSGGPCRLE
jgi:hypothetical protein